MSLVNVWLLLGLLASAIAVVLTQHQARSLYIRLHDMQEQTRKLEVERTELQLEQSMLSGKGRIEAVARERLDMAIPNAAQIQPLPSLTPGAAGTAGVTP